MSRALTIVATIAPHRLEALEADLATIAGDLDGTKKTNTILLPSALPRTHFVRWVIVPGAAEGLPPLLVMESTYDGGEERYLLDIAAAAAPGLDRIFGHGVDYPSNAARDGAPFVTWMGAHAVRAEAFYAAYRDVTKAQVDSDAALHDRIRAVLDGAPRLPKGIPAVKALASVCDALKAAGVAARTFARDADGMAEDRARVRASVALVLAALPAVVAALPLVLPTLFYKEATDEPGDYPHPVHDKGGLRLGEDRIVQNQLTNVVVIKSGPFRLALLRAVLLVIDLLARTVYTHGDLGGITTIHFARWVILRDPRDLPWSERKDRLAFFSNYDGSWESYLGEFVDRASVGLTAIWSNTVAFPRTWGLVGKGARDEEAFKNWARSIQIPTQVWWSGVPASSAENIRANIRIREGLARIETETMNETEARSWLRSL